MSVTLNKLIMGLFMVVFSKLSLHRKKSVFNRMTEGSKAETILLLSSLPKSIIEDVYCETTPGFDYLQNSFAQNGEDIVLNRFLIGHPRGKFLDIGAYHPFKFSNTALLYKNGWTGTNIDASKSNLESFFKYRPLDFSVQNPVTKDGAELVFYEFEEAAFNTFSQSYVEELHNLGIFPISRGKIKTVEFQKIVEEYGSTDTYVLNIDVEGLDYDLLECPVFDEFKPCFIIFESSNSISFELLRLSENKSLFHYDIVSVLFNSFILRSKNCAPLHFNITPDSEID
jgi:hypothetical protein